MVELSPFRTVVDLSGPPLYGILNCGAMDATIENANVRPDITAPLTWPAGAFASRVQLQPSFPPFNGYAGRWVPLTTPEVDPERHPGYKQGSSIELRYWGYSASGPTECVIPSLRPIVMESGRLSTAEPPETRADLTQYPGALTLNFVPITVNERTFVPVGISAGYVAAGDITWLGAERPFVSVLYKAQDRTSEPR